MFIICRTSADNARTETRDDAIDRCIAALASEEGAAEAAMNELYGLIASSVYSFALSILKNSHDAEDVLHDCCVLLYSAAGGYRSAGKPLAWILTIARNLALKKLRERGRSGLLSEEETERVEAVLSPDLSPEDRTIIALCLEELNDEERQIVLLHAVSGFRHREIAAFLRLPLPTVLSKYNRALKKLRKLLEGENRE